MLTIHFKLVEAMIAQAKQDHPIETCGVIAGVEGSNLPLRFIPMINAAASETFFEFAPKQHLQVWRKMDENDEEPVVLYHSHTDSQAYPSRSDIELATEPQAHYVIIPTNPKYGDEIRSFRIVNGTVTEERVQVVNEYKSLEQPIIENGALAAAEAV
ncbi:MAG: peptidase [Methylococcaceae bacterium]|nr:peptidase [Methylococcaceae bacterium]